ncbi:hypothetical protein E2C01_042093 [Portunus trituberculatus]|uniref:Uncharacterized protein n=1 Tax=Portunus trituberculatus TaxID=210409 RepID=A0A5B7FSF9_PORTR|nr:hypothetical protein [Portunus trituberculatus]
MVQTQQFLTRYIEGEKEGRAEQMDRELCGHDAAVDAPIADGATNTEMVD